MKRVVEGWNRFVDLTVVPSLLPAVEKGVVPDAVIRAGGWVTSWVLIRWRAWALLD